MATSTAVFSGPGGFRAQAVAALEKDGFTVDPDASSRGLPDTVSGEDDPTQGFIAVHGDDVDIDAASSSIANLNWVLRAHHGAPLKTAPLLGEQEAAHEQMVRRIVNEELDRRADAVKLNGGVV